MFEVGLLWMSDRDGAPSELGGAHGICTEEYFGLAIVCKADFGCFDVMSHGYRFVREYVYAGPAIVGCL